MRTDGFYGTVASMFTYFEGKQRPGEWNEIDVEIVSSKAITGQPPFSTNIIYGDGADQKLSDHEYTQWVDYSVPHDYTIEWTPEYISWIYDGEVIRKDVDTPGVKAEYKE